VAFENVAVCDERSILLIESHLCRTAARRFIRSAAILIKKLSGSSATFTLYFKCHRAIGAKHFRSRQMKTRPKLNFGRVL